MSKDLQSFAKNNKTFMPTAETVERKWYVIDATGLVLGRLASQVASILKGKNKPEYTPNVDCGDHVIIINCDSRLSSACAEILNFFGFLSSHISPLYQLSLSSTGHCA